MLNLYIDDVDPNDDDAWYPGRDGSDNCPPNCDDNCATCILGGALECEEDWPEDEDEAEDSGCECDDCIDPPFTCKYCKHYDGSVWPEYDTHEEWESN